MGPVTLTKENIQSLLSSKKENIVPYYVMCHSFFYFWSTLPLHDSRSRALVPSSGNMDFCPGPQTVFKPLNLSYILSQKEKEKKEHTFLLLSFLLDCEVFIYWFRTVINHH